jgi:hypothetical protein
VSTAEILTQLPKLSVEERRALARRLFELDPAREELDLCAEAADAAFLELDRQESQDNARRASR